MCSSLFMLDSCDVHRRMSNYVSDAAGGASPYTIILTPVVPNIAVPKPPRCATLNIVMSNVNDYSSGFTARTRCYSHSINIQMHDTWTCGCTCVCVCHGDIDITGFRCAFGDYSEFTVTPAYGALIPPPIPRQAQTSALAPFTRSLACRK